VPPGEPHLLARGVERDRQPRQHAVAGPIGSSARNRRASASTNAAAEPWLTATPFGVPVEPDVKMIHASSSGPGVPGRADRCACVGQGSVVAEHRAHPGLAEHELGPLVRVVGVDGHVRGARGEDREDRDVQLGGAGGDPDADAVADPDAALGEAPDGRRPPRPACGR
jgi:hypothetical protein